MSFDTLAALTVFAFVSSITPGPNNMMLLTSGVNFGFRRSIPHMLGITVGFSIMIFLVGIGVGRILASAPAVYEVLKAVSVIYLLWLAWKIATADPLGPDNLEKKSAPLTFLQAAAFQWVNPKAWTICLTAVSAYTVPQHFFVGVVIVTLLFLVVNLPSISVWTVFGVSLRTWLSNPRRVRQFNIAMALALVASLWPVVAEYVR